MLVVITGGPSVGKSTLISLLEQEGYPVMHEQATRTIKEGEFLPWVDRDAFQKEVFKRQIQAEEELLAANKPVFLDRGVYDGEAYYICDGMPIPEIFHSVDASRYAKVFLLDPLDSFDNNGVRFENLEFTLKITPVVENCYLSRGVDVVRLPATSPEERLATVLDSLNLPAAKSTQEAEHSHWRTVPHHPARAGNVRHSHAKPLTISVATV